MDYIYGCRYMDICNYFSHIGSTKAYTVPTLSLGARGVFVLKDYAIT